MSAAPPESVVEALLHVAGLVAGAHLVAVRAEVTFYPRMQMQVVGDGADGVQAAAAARLQVARDGDEAFVLGNEVA